MYNHTGLQGRLTADPELRYTQQGTAITSFTLASDTGRKTKDGKKITNFIECVAWRAQAEFVCKYLSKGRLVLVEGELTSRSYVSMGALLGSPVILFLESENSTTDVMNGDFRWDIAVTPTPPLKSASVYVAYTDAGFSVYYEGGDE